MNQPGATQASQDNDTDVVRMDADTPPAVLCFNACDPTGAGGLTSDALVIASIGAHALPVVTGSYWRDTRETVGYAELDDSAISDHARMAAEDMPLHAIKVGMLGSAEAVAAVAAFAADYPDVPVIAYMPELSWWDESEIDAYQDAFRELLLPQTAVLVGNNTTLRHWLLPESTTDRHARATDLARAAAEMGVPYVVITGMPQPGDRLGNVLATPQAELFSQAYERIDSGFLGAGDILSAALAGLIATGTELTQALGEALQYLDQSLDHGFHPGMGRAVADRLFWAETDDPADDAEPGAAPDDGDAPAPPASIELPEPSNDTKH